MSKLVITTIFLILTILSTVSGQGSPASAPVAAPAPVSGDLAPTAPGPTVDCLTPVLNMSDCLGYVQQGSNSTVPDKNCCPELAGLIESNPLCLCQLLGSNITEQYGIKLDIGKALKLPAICKIDAPSFTLCSAFGYPVGAPASGPASGPSAGSAATPEGLATSPSSGAKDGSGASSIVGSTFAIFGGLAFSYLLTLF